MGVLLDPVIQLSEMFRDNVGFSAWLGLTTHNATETARRVYVDGVARDEPGDETMSVEEMQRLRPFCILYPDESAGYNFELRGMPNCWRGSGQIMAVLSRAYDAKKSIDQHFREAAALVEPIISSDNPATPGLLQQRNEPGRLSFTGLRVVFHGRTPLEHVDEYGDCYDVVFVFTYGG